MAKAEYQRLTNWRIRWTSTTIVLAFLFPISLAFATRCKIWLGEDHLLCVDSNGYAETYKRFYFRDIQAITLQQTERGRIWSIVLGVAFMFFLFVFLFTQPKGPPAGWSGGEMAGEIVLGGLMAVMVLFLVINVLSSPTCKTFLRTAVQTEELPSLCHVRQTRKVLEKIRPLIAAAQGGELAPEIISEMMRQQAQSSTTVPATTTTDSPGIPPVIDS